MKKDGKYIGKRTFRNPKDLVKLNIDYGEEWFLEKYALIRNAEEGHPLSDARVKQVVKRANKIGKIKGKARCLEMINKNIVDTSRRSGSHSEKVRIMREDHDKQELEALKRQRKPGSMGY